MNRIVARNCETSAPMDSFSLHTRFSFFVHRRNENGEKSIPDLLTPPKQNINTFIKLSCFTNIKIAKITLIYYGKTMVLWKKHGKNYGTIVNYS